MCFTHKEIDHFSEEVSLVFNFIDLVLDDI